VILEGDDFDKAVFAAIDQLVVEDYGYDDNEKRMARAGWFVAMFGSLGDLWDEPDLSKMQFRVAANGSPWRLISDWSVDRVDPREEPGPGFARHIENTGCIYCVYLESMRNLRERFLDAVCDTCGLGLNAHRLSWDSSCNAVAECQVWERGVPFVAPAGVVREDVQVGEAYCTWWEMPLVDGTFARVARSYYLAKEDGRTFVEREDEYLICRDLADPGGTEVYSETMYVEVDSHDPGGEDPYFLAEQSFAPCEEYDWDPLPKESMVAAVLL
jgi:hypothetical protein